MTPADSNTLKAAPEDAAILLMSLGEENAAAVFKHLSPKEVQKVGEAIARMHAVPRERVDSVLERFGALARARAPSSPTRRVRARRAAQGARRRKAELLLDRIMQSGDVSGIESLKWMEPNAVAELLRNEHPQIAAAILVHLDFDQASAVLKCFAERQRNEVLLRVGDARRHPALGAEGPQRRDVPRHRRRRAAAQVLARRREDGRRDHQPARRQRRDLGPGLPARRRRRASRSGSWTTCSASTIWSRSTTRASRRCSRRSRPSRSSSRSGARRRTARQDLRQHVDPRRRDAARRPRVARPGARVGGRGRAEGTAQGRAPASPTRARS